MESTKKYDMFVELEKRFVVEPIQRHDVSSIQKDAIGVINYLLTDTVKKEVDFTVSMYIAMTYFERYLSTSKELDSKVHLYIIPCMTMAMKYRSKRFDMTTFLCGEDTKIDISVISAMEIKVCSKLGWDIYPLTAFEFIDVLLPLLACDGIKKHMAYKLLLEVQVEDYFRYTKPSVLALAALVASSGTEINNNSMQEIKLLQLNNIEEEQVIKYGKKMITIRQKESFSNWDRSFTTSNLSPLQFDIDWLISGDSGQESFIDSLSSSNPLSNRFLTFYSNSRNCNIELDQSMKTTTKLVGVFDNIYWYEYVENERPKKSYIKVLPSSEDNKKHLKLLKEKPHSNILRCQDTVIVGDNIFAMFACKSDSLRVRMNSAPPLSLKDTGFEPKLIQKWMYQLLDAINHYHSEMKISHRHIMPESILIGQKDDAFLGDFRLSIEEEHGINFRNRHDTNVSYRAPELLIGTFVKVEQAEDIWALACVFGELVTGDGLFKGTNVRERVMSIFRLLGDPTEETWQHADQILPSDNSREKMKPQDIKEALKLHNRLDDTGIELLSAMLRLDPTQRVTADKALKFSYFSDLRSTSS